MRLMGTETEYGLYVEGVEPGGLDLEVAKLIESYGGPAATAWDYSAEDPRRDMRGFRVDELARDAKDAQYDTRGPAGATPSDRVLANGARLYNDHSHPEYSTPECTTLRDLVAHDKAGERILLRCAERMAESLGAQPVLYKNNVDFDGMSYGCHENYLVSRDVPMDDLITGIMPFLVTRQVFAGAGKVGVERHRAKGVHFQLSQRADYIDEEASVDTLAKRPIVNTRDEAHADRARHRRLHVICGDANMSEYALALKLGTTALVLSCIERGTAPSMKLRQPVKAMRAVSWDLSLGERLRLEDGRRLTAIDIQREYLQAAGRLPPQDDDHRWVLAEWAATLDQLESDWTPLADRLDWVAKHELLQSFTEAEGAAWTDDVMRSLDLAYHDIHPATGLYYGLQEQGRMRRIVGEADIEAAVTSPPAATRAAVRGACVARFAEHIKAATWGKLYLSVDGAEWCLHLEDMVDGSAGDLAEQVRSVPSIEELGRLLARRGGG